MFVLSVTTTPSAWGGTASLAPTNGKIETALGLHPQLAAERCKELSLFDELLPSVRWVGEVGLDGSPECRDSWRSQNDVFEHILRSCSKVGGRLLSVHSRRAARDVLDALKRHPDAGLTVLHWFSGTIREVEEAIDQGCWFSVGLPMLRSSKGRAIVNRIPRDRVLTETDGPFTQMGTNPSYPWDVQVAKSELGQLWNLPDGEVEIALSDNLSRLLDWRSKTSFG